LPASLMALRIQDPIKIIHE